MSGSSNIFATSSHTPSTSLRSESVGPCSALGMALVIAAATALVYSNTSVESTVIPITDVIFEHRMYLPTAGAAVALGTALLWVIERLRLRAPLAAQCAVGLLMTAGPLGAAAYSRNLVWKNDLTLWSDVVAKSPANARPHNFLGLALFDSGAADEAMREYAFALTIRPSYPEALMNLGYARWAKGELSTAPCARTVRRFDSLPASRWRTTTWAPPTRGSGAHLRRRRSRGQTGADRAFRRAGDVELDLDAPKRGRREELALTSREFDLLAFFVAHPDRVYSREQLMEGVGGRATSGTARTVDNFIARLRAHIGDDAEQPRHLETVRGIGDRFNP